MKKTSFLSINVLILFVFLLTTVACDKDDDGNSTIKEFKNIALSGANEVPAVASTGSGTFNGTYDMNTKILTYSFNWTLGDNTATTTNMHFHGPASPTESAGVALGISGFPVTSTGTVSGVTPMLTDAQEAELLGGKWYVNIHSSTVPGGELRGNLLL